jgi:hypothetical protein
VDGYLESIRRMVTQAEETEMKRIYLALRGWHLHGFVATFTDDGRKLYWCTKFPYQQESNLFSIDAAYEYEMGTFGSKETFWHPS